MTQTLRAVVIKIRFLRCKCAAQSLRARRHGDQSVAVTKETTEGHTVYDEGLSLEARPAAGLFLWFLFTPLCSAVTLSALFLVVV